MRHLRGRCAARRAGMPRLRAAARSRVRLWAKLATSVALLPVVRAARRGMKRAHEDGDLAERRLPHRQPANAIEIELDAQTNPGRYPHYAVFHLELRYDDVLVPVPLAGGDITR